MEVSRPSKAVLKLKRGTGGETRKALPPLCAVLAGGLEPLGSGGRPITPLGFQPKLTCTPESGRAPVSNMLAQKHSANHEHCRGKPENSISPIYSFGPFMPRPNETIGAANQAGVKILVFQPNNPVVNDRLSRSTLFLKRSEAFSSTLAIM